jgi:hypothetical protein
MKRWLALLALISAPALADVDGVMQKALDTGTISRGDVANIYLLKERVWRNGDRVRVYRFPLADSLTAGFARDVLNTNPESLRKEWLRLVNAGLAVQPIEVKDQKQMLLEIGKRPGAVGYLSHDYFVTYGKGGDAAILRIVD